MPLPVAPAFDATTIYLVVFHHDDGRSWMRASTYSDHSRLTTKMLTFGASRFSILGTFEMRPGCGHSITEYDYDTRGQKIPGTKVVITM